MLEQYLNFSWINDPNNLSKKLMTLIKFTEQRTKIITHTKDGKQTLREQLLTLARREKLLEENNSNTITFYICN